MAGNPIRRMTSHALSEMGEDKLFQAHLEMGSVPRALKHLEEDLGKVSEGMFYAWLHEDDSRWERWQKHLKIVAHILAGESLEIVDETADNPRGVASARLRAEQRRWLASRYNRQAFGKTPETTVVGINFADDYMTALKRVEERRKKEDAIEAEYEVLNHENGENEQIEEKTDSSEAAEGLNSE